MLSPLEIFIRRANLYYFGRQLEACPDDAQRRLFQARLREEVARLGPPRVEHNREPARPVVWIAQVFQSEDSLRDIQE